jgi:hypothetical protein
MVRKTIKNKKKSLGKKNALREKQGYPASGAEEIAKSLQAKRRKE